MRRGLIARSLTELPDAVFDARLKRVRETMQRAQLDALIVYTNNTVPLVCRGSRVLSHIGRKRCWWCRAKVRLIWSRR